MKETRRSRLLPALLAALLASFTLPTLAAPGPCADEKSHQFDFWIGEWEVTEGDEPAGTNNIQPILDGCVLQENWRGAKGSAGSSFNFYNPETKKWHQLWVWRQGTTIELAGELRDGKMILEGEKKGSDGETVRNRITWTPNADGSVRQYWESSTDQGKTWQSVFDGLYRKRK